jgi:hypothetical protein
MMNENRLGDIMFAPLLLGLGLLTPPASADPQQIRYDSYADDGDMMWGGYFMGFDGLGMDNCMAVVYSFEEAHFPLMPTGLKIFWAGEGAGVTSEALMTFYIDWYEGDADADTMRAGLYSRLEQKTILVSGIDLEGTWQEIDFETERMTFDFEPDVDGDQPITYGSVIVSVCYDNRQGLPEIAMDTNGWKDEPLPSGDDDFIEGHETSKFRNLIQWNHRWDMLDTYLIEQFGYTDGGDFIMRLNIDAQHKASGSSLSCQQSEDWNVLTVHPNVAEAGQSTDVLIAGDYNFPDNSTAQIGSYDLVDVSPNTDCGIEARVDKHVPEGSYDVVVSAPDGSQMTLENGFTVQPSKDGGCGYTNQRQGRALWWLPLIGMGLLVRRRD